MAVAAADLALGDLLLEDGEADVPHHAADLVPFGTDVIEFEHCHVGLAAVDALATRQHAVHVIEVPPNRSGQRSTRIVDVAGEA